MFANSDFRPKIKEKPPKLPPKNPKSNLHLHLGSSIEDDFQIISTSPLLSSVNLKDPCIVEEPGTLRSVHTGNSSVGRIESKDTFFHPGCGHRECTHCESAVKVRDRTITHHSRTEARRSVINPVSELTGQLSAQNGPKLPPKPPWMSLPLPPASITELALTSNYSHVQRYFGQISDGSRVADMSRVSDISVSVSSDSSEQEPVIYSKNVKIARNNEESKKKGIIGLDQPKAQNISGNKSEQLFADRSADLKALTVHEHLKEMEDEKDTVKKKISDCDTLIDGLGERLDGVATTSEAEKFRIHNKDMEKITALMYSLASRMAKCESCLENDKISTAEKQEVLKKQEKLRVQLSEAKVLKAMIEKRTETVVGYLEKYLKSHEKEIYKKTLTAKVSLIVDLRELEDRLYVSRHEFTTAASVSNLFRNQ